ncbi:hypothetical protein [Filimonas effusa]|uniref:Coproporphyrinogen III oxidase n=1 Tax=Filimonas effusa TaxID=2508721 RepID=A0A4Q1CZW9_9BACT|nr:hypothetical protein [Filimonas effusa]RXK80968.1 hypothetical protein ESB13_22710 [Filimonas effusa]
MKRMLAVCMLAATIFGVSCGTNENKTNTSGDSVLNSPPPPSMTDDNTGTPGTTVDSTAKDTMGIDTGHTRH